MKLTDKYFGYPVISPISDDYEGLFSVDIHTQLDESNQELIIHTNVHLDNKDIKQLVEKGKASIVLHLEESKTCYREIYIINNQTNRLVISVGKFRENIEVSSFVIANEKIEFEPESVHSFYKMSRIIYEPYQTIGIALPQSIEISKEVDEIKNSSSIFSIIPDKTGLQKYMKVELREERVVIIMPNEDYILYHRLMRQNLVKNNHKEILLSNIVMPIMVEVLQTLQEQYTIYEDKIWFKSLVAAYKEMSIDILSLFEDNSFSPYYYAQIIFDGVISKSLVQLQLLV